MMSKVKQGPNPIDVHVGGRLRQLRNYKGLTQEQLANSADITFQQVQKYENGRNRLSASRLVLFAQALDVHPMYFFEGIGGIDISLPTSSKKIYQEKDTPDAKSKEEMQVLRLFRASPEHVQAAVLGLLMDMVKALTPKESEEGEHGQT
ncbi:helix-turn-helix domain-containing protein [Cerasicoccus fimbriatus]|uniref:helix-turn-helix domain-containing protein n=1 Tax=Cerasicoccus fimbriatus TaxID=3014554 RepID=UPI0022B55EA7|nr:helix-turn-helix domain-containing protein [Cerasicoccus sp. TK19100]